MDAVKVIALLACAGCSLDMSPAQPWMPIDDLEPPLRADLVQPDITSVATRLPAVMTRPVRVVTYNVQYAPDVPALVEAIRGEPSLASAGVFLIQEIEAHDEEVDSRARQLADELGLGYVYVPARSIPGGTHGLAILSAFPIADVERMDLRESSNPSQHRIAIQATIDVDGHPLHVIDLHLDTMLSAQQRVAQLSPIVIDAPATALVGGDFNSCWVEWANGSVPVLSASRASDQAPVIDSYMSAIGFATPTRDSGPTEHMFGLEQRLDSIYTRGIVATFGAVERVGPSDHWPMWIDIDLQ
jgi:endonuclease/exonuclease/phosphatase family metal-dependent hydrolase